MTDPIFYDDLYNRATNSALSYFLVEAACGLKVCVEGEEFFKDNYKIIKEYLEGEDYDNVGCLEFN